MFARRDRVNVDVRSPMSRFRYRRSTSRYSRYPKSLENPHRAVFFSPISSTGAIARYVCRLINCMIVSSCALSFSLLKTIFFINIINTLNLYQVRLTKWPTRIPSSRCYRPSVILESFDYSRPRIFFYCHSAVSICKRIDI